MVPPPSVGRSPLNFAIACQGGLRLIRTSPGLAAFAIGALALGIGFTTTMFGIVHGATRPLPVEQPDEIVAIQKTAIRRVTGSLASHALVASVAATAAVAMAVPVRRAASIEIARALRQE
jgi:hypothetical protein